MFAAKYLNKAPDILQLYLQKNQRAVALGKFSLNFLNLNIRIFGNDYHTIF